MAQAYMSKTSYGKKQNGRHERTSGEERYKWRAGQQQGLDIFPDLDYQWIRESYTVIISGNLSPTCIMYTY